MEKTYVADALKKTRGKTKMKRPTLCDDYVDQFATYPVCDRWGRSGVFRAIQMMGFL